MSKFEQLLDYLINEEMDIAIFCVAENDGILIIVFSEHSLQFLAHRKNLVYGDRNIF